MCFESYGKLDFLTFLTLFKVETDNKYTFKLIEEVLIS